MSKKYSVKWVFNPDFEGCETCQDAGGQIYDSEPEGPHPNCECESVEVYVDEDDNIIDDIDETEEMCADVTDTDVTVMNFCNYSRNGDLIEVTEEVNSSEFEDEFEGVLFFNEGAEYSHDSISFDEAIEPERGVDYYPCARITWNVQQYLCLEEKVYDNNDELTQELVSNDVTITLSDYSFEWD